MAPVVVLIFGLLTLLGLVTVVVVDPPPAGFLTRDNAACAPYQCSGGCGECFNPGGREGVLCKGQQTGYFCSSDIGQGTQGDVTFACMDWTFGSHAMVAAETKFNTRTSDNVYFGVGTYGTSSDPQRGLGACYRMKVEGLDRDLLVQSINTGSDVAGNQFDLQIGAGGAGAFNNCAGADGSMYPGDKSVWGDQYGGVHTKAECAALPSYPRDDAPMKASGDTLVSLCEYGFDKKVRIDCTGQSDCESNPTLLDVARVKCPEELVQMTWMQRSDDPTGYVAHSESIRDLAFPNTANDVCHTGGGGGTAYCLTRMMDCRKPSGAFKDNVRADVTVPGRRLVQTCTADGFTRIDVQCGCMGCYC